MDVSASRSTERSYSNSRGASIYPIEEGYIFKVKKPKYLYNTNAHASLPHTTYLWILRVGQLPKGQAPQFRRIRVARLFVAESRPDDYVMKVAWTARKRVCETLSGGYSVVATDCYYHYTKPSVAKFYRAVGLL